MIRDACSSDRARFIPARFRHRRIGNPERRTRDSLQRTSQGDSTMKHSQQKEPGESRQEQTIDEMVEETFPASDATQLPGRAAGAPEAGADAPDPRREFRPTTPRTIGNQGVMPSTRQGEERVSLGGDKVVTFCDDPDARTVSVRFSEEQLALNAAALDRLIAALSERRTRMQD
jgi:hypothetical protein